MILVTGGTGLLGSHLLYDLVQNGNPVRAIKRQASDIEMVKKVFTYYTSDEEKLFSRISWVDADLMDFGAIEDALEGVDEVYHSGAVVSFYPKDHKEMIRVNTGGTANLVNLSLTAGVRKFCYVSSVATLGRAENHGPSDENTFWVPSRKNSVYSISKYGAEREVWRGMEEGLNAVIVNPSVILGPGFWNDNSGLFRLVWEGLKYYTTGINGYVDARDVSHVMITLMDRRIFGERFIVSAGNVNYFDFFSMIARYLDRPAPSRHVPAGITSLAWRLEAVRAFLMRSKPEVTREMAVTTTQEYMYSNEKVTRLLNFSFRPVEDSIREICGYFLEDHKNGKRKSGGRISAGAATQSGYGSGKTG